MKFHVQRYGIDIIPENKQDEAYIEEVLGLRANGATATVIRRNAIGMDCLGYISITKAAPEGETP